MAKLPEPGKYTNSAPTYTRACVGVTTRARNCGNVASTVEETRVATLTVEADLAHPVAAFKQQVCRDWVIPVHRQILTFGTRVLRDHQPLGSYGVVHGSNLALELAARPPSPI